MTQYSGFSSFSFFALAIVCLIGGALAGYYIAMPKPEQGIVAVTLDSGHVFFGRIEDRSKSRILLADVFYVNATTSVLLHSSQGITGDLELLKLGREAHSPESRMDINREHIRFVERLKEEGKVYQAIKSSQP